MKETKPTVLVVDDERDVVEFLTTLLRDHGYQVLACGTGGDAVRLAREQMPALISLDITMPQESGSAAYRELRHDEKTRGIPIVIVTGYDDPNLEKFLSTRKSVPAPDGYFDKPIDPDAFIAKVDELARARV